jgi:hypothetical protein
VIEVLKARRVRTNNAALYCGISGRTLEKLRVIGGGPAFYKIGRAVTYDINDLEHWLADKRRVSTSDFGKEAA